MALARGQITITNEDYLLDKTRVKVQAKDLDPNKYYPLIIKLPKPYKDTRLYGIRIERPLYDKSLGIPPYATHTNGYTLVLEWSVQAMGYGAQGHNRRTHSYQTKFLREGERVVSAPNQEYRTSYEYVYLRGGSDVWVEFTGATDVDIAIYSEGLDLGSGYGNYRFEVLDSIASLGEPKIDLDTLKDSLLAEVSKARTDLQGVITRAQGAMGDAFQRELQAVLASLGSLTAKLDESEGRLQKQIDKQVERWFGDSMARSGVPPTNLWDAADNAKHEGDTYTCVAPKGVTITTTNAHEYPNVGRSWRWTNGGSGDAYGWVLIADTDITQALALASKAQATADGKMTHYITPTPPVTYQQGDQWTLPAPWQGRKDGRAYTYPAGSILTATADSISGQHHPEHWCELVRYTDLSLQDIKLGARNLVLQSGTAKTSNVYHVGTWRLSEGWQADTEYTIVVWGRCSGASSQPLDIYPNTGRNFLAQVVVPAGETALLGYVTVMMPQSKIYAGAERELRLYAMSNHPNRGGSVEYVIERIAVVRGNMPPQSWTPAPEDVAEELQRKADEAERRAKEHADAKAIAEAEARAKLAKSLQTAEERVASLDYLKAVLAKGKAEALKVKDGAVVVPLLLNNYIGILDLAGKLRATLSGDTKGRLFIGAGLDDQGVPKVEITHRGDARFGDLYIYPDGRIEVKTARNADPYIRFGSQLPSLESIISKAGTQRSYSGRPLRRSLDSMRVIEHTPSDTKAHREETYNEVLVSQIELPEGHRLSVAGTINTKAIDLSTLAAASCTLTLSRNGSEAATLVDTASASSLDSGVDEVLLDYTSTTLQAGTYTLTATIELQVTNGRDSRAEVSLSGIEVRVEPIRDYDYTAFGTDGVAAVFGEDKYLYLSKARRSAFVTARGAWDISGVLLSGTCNYTTSLANVYNPRWETRSVTARSESGKGNVVVITHNLGHTDYSVSVTPVYQSGMEDKPYIAMVTARTETYIKVACWRQWGSSTNAQRCAFDFVFTGRN